MVSDGSSFKLYIPPRNRAIEGTETITKPSKNGLENLRPAVFFDSLLIQGLGPGQIISETSDTHLVRPADPQKPTIEEPDYELAVLAEPEKTGRANDPGDPDWQNRSSAVCAGNL